MINPGQFERVTFAVGLAQVRPHLRARIMADILSVAFATGRRRTQNRATRSMMVEAAIAIASMGHPHTAANTSTTCG